MVLPEITRFFQAAWTLLGLVSLYSLYLQRYSIPQKREMVKQILMATLYIGFGLAIDYFAEQWDLTPTEFRLATLLLTGLFVIYVFPKSVQLPVLRLDLSLKMRRTKAVQVIRETLKVLRIKPDLSDSPFQFTAKGKGVWGMDYLLSVNIDSTQEKAKESKVEITSKAVGNTAWRPSVLFFLAAYPVVQSRATNSLRISIPFYRNKVDAEVLFFLLFLLLVIHLYLGNSIQAGMLNSIEQIHRGVILELAKRELQAKQKGEAKLGLKKPELEKPDLEEAKKKAEKIKEMKAKQALEEKQKRLRDRVKSVFGDEASTDEELKNVDPELIKRQALISKVKKILKATPVGMEVSLKQITEKAGHDNPDEIELIIISLIDRNEVGGQYDIWSQTYVTGTTSIRFIEKMLRNLELVPDEIEYLRLNKGGDVEIRFRSPTDERAQTVLTNSDKNPAKATPKSDNKKQSSKKPAK